MYLGPLSLLFPYWKGLLAYIQLNVSVSVSLSLSLFSLFNIISTHWLDSNLSINKLSQLHVLKAALKTKTPSADAKNDMHTQQTIPYSNFSKMSVALC